MILNDDTICAVSTPIGVGAIGIIRISGKEAKSITEKLWQKPPISKPRYFYHGTLINPKTNELIDDAGLIYFQAPYSFTGEDVIELQVHSGQYILSTIISILLAEGARLAEKGEFTKRAFLNGKLDLTKAEAINGLISAKTKTAQIAALDQLRGKLFYFIDDLKEKLTLLLEQIEASIDFPEEVEPLPALEIADILTELKNKITPLIKKQNYGRYITSGLKCLIVGKPNVGKSSLLNKIAGHERAIVSMIPGTTRDFIDITIDLKGVLFEFIDTAGLRDTDDEIEKLGAKKVADLIDSSDAIIWLLDGSEKLAAEDMVVYENIKHKAHIYLVINKIDLPPHLEFENLKNIISAPMIKMSLLSNDDSGLDELKELLFTDFIGKFDNQGSDLICNIRQIDVLKKLNQKLGTIITNLPNLKDDMLAEECKDMLVILSEITGEEISEEIINNIFNKFCIGK